EPDAGAGNRETPTPQHGRLAAGSRRELLQQPALADSRLARDDGDDGRAAARSRKSVMESGQLAGPPDEADSPSRHGVTLPRRERRWEVSCLRYEHGASLPASLSSRLSTMTSP